MSEPISTNEVPPKEKIDYTTEYLARYAKAKAEAEARGLIYNYPSFVGPGWKIHLNVPDITWHPLTQDVARFTRDHRYLYKVGRTSGQEGKGMTIYIGDKDTSHAFAQELQDSFGDQLASPGKDVLANDTALVRNVWGRFDIGQDAHEFHQYGSAGIPYLNNDMLKVAGLWGQEKMPATEALKRADTILRKKYGVFYTGTPWYRKK